MGNVLLTTEDGRMAAVVAEPGGEPRGGIVVVQEAFGLTPHILAVTARLAQAGWLAVAPALFHRQGSPVFAYDDFASVGPAIQQLTGPGIDDDVDATVRHLTERGFTVGQIGIVGFCMGGSVAFRAATRLPLGAAVTFYGGGVAEGRFGLPSLLDQAPSLQAPWLGLYGDRDTGIPVEQIEALREAAAAVSVRTEIVRYPEAEHGFNCDDRASFHPGSAADAWARALAWFEDHLA